MKNRLADLRKERNILQKEVCSVTGISRQALSALENGISLPTLIVAFKLARFFEVPIEEIFIFEDEK